MPAYPTSSTSPLLTPRQRNWLRLNDELRRLSLLYPEAKHDDDSLNVVAWEWARLLDAWEVNNIEFRDAMTVLKGNCRWFPTPGDLKAAIDWVREHPPRVPEDRRLEAYTFGPFPEERQEKTRRAVEIIAAQLKREITSDEAARRIAALGFAG